MSSFPVKAPPTAPKANIRELPRKKAVTVVLTAAALFLAKRTKLGVAVPPLTKEPITSPTPARTVSSPEDLAKMAARPPPSTAERTIEYTPSAAMRGTETALITVRALMPK